MESSIQFMADPIVKWVGGKAAIRDLIVKHFPRPDKYSRYVEPFCGGAAIALSMQCEKIVINDINTNLINVYQCLKDFEGYYYICEKLRIWQECCDYLSEGFYYQLRTNFNLLRQEKKFDSNYVRAAEMIALNKLGFNGLFRVNSKGEFNVPWGKRKPGTKIYEPDKLEAIHKKLQTIEIYNKNYWEVDYQPGDFVYFDPPYDTDKTNFTGYNSTPFLRKEQENLAAFCDNLSKYYDVKFCLSNASTKFIWELYQGYDFNIYEIEAPRRISFDGNRAKVKEVLITNYEV